MKKLALPVLLLALTVVFSSSCVPLTNRSAPKQSNAAPIYKKYDAASRLASGEVQAIEGGLGYKFGQSIDEIDMTNFRPSTSVSFRYSKVSSEFFSKTELSFTPLSRKIYKIFGRKLYGKHKNCIKDFNLIQKSIESERPGLLLFLLDLPSHMSNFRYCEGRNKRIPAFWKGNCIVLSVVNPDDEPCLLSITYSDGAGTSKAIKEEKQYYKKHGKKITDSLKLFDTEIPSSDGKPSPNGL